MSFLPHLLESSQDTDSITLPNGLPVYCLLYADDLILISSSAAGLQRQVNILHTYSDKWLLKINLKRQKHQFFKTKVVNQHMISSLSFWIAFQLTRLHSIVTLALLLTQMKILLIPKNLSLIQHSCSLCKHYLSKSLLNVWNQGSK